MSITDEEIQQFQKLYQKIDIDGDGSITREELNHAIQTELQDSFMKELIIQSVDEMDRDGNGSISYIEFINTLKKNGARVRSQYEAQHRSVIPPQPTYYPPPAEPQHSVIPPPQPTYYPPPQQQYYPPPQPIPQQQPPVVVHVHETTTVTKTKSSEGSDGIIAALAYLFGWISALIVLLLCKSKYNRFHGWQSLFLSIIYTIVWIILVIIDSVAISTWILVWIWWVIIVIIIIVCMIKAYQLAGKGKLFKLPLLGKLAKKMSHK